MSDAMLVLIVLASGTYALKAGGPLVLGDRALPSGLRYLVDLLPAALLAALTMVATVGADRAVVLDARFVGLVTAAVALWRRAPFWLVVILASAATALARLVN